MSDDDQPVAAAKVNIIGSFDKADIAKLRTINPGDSVRISIS